jgi:hypothetical protein
MFFGLPILSFLFILDPIFYSEVPSTGLALIIIITLRVRVILRRRRLSGKSLARSTTGNAAGGVRLRPGGPLNRRRRLGQP